MNQYEVTFTVYEDVRPSGYRSTTSSLSNLKTIVSARNPSQARSMVEAQYGGPEYVQIYAVYTRN